MSAPPGPDPRTAPDGRAAGTRVSPADSRADPVGFGPPVQAGEVGTLGPHRVITELGRGGMGVVYAALDTRLGRKLALKVMLPAFAADPAARARFLREARAAALIAHDNVVTVFEADERDGIPYIAMQYLEGFSLDEWLKGRGLSLAQSVRVARETAHGLAAAHARGLVHRDIKPANLWLCTEGSGGRGEGKSGAASVPSPLPPNPFERVKVLDFGLARPVEAADGLTRDGAVVGTPGYMSPEQARGAKADHRADLFSLGAVLYRLVTGRPPFVGPSAIAVIMSLAHDEPPAVREVNPQVPAALAELIHQLLAKDPARRPATADEVARRLAAIEAELAARTAPDESVTPRPDDDSFDDSDVTEAVSSAFSVGPPRRDARGVWAAAALAVLLAVGAVVAVVVATRGTGTRPTPPTDSVAVPAHAPDPLPPEPPEPPAPPPDDRGVAEWVLDAGGFAHVDVPPYEVKAGTELPAGRFTLLMVNLDGTRAVDDDLKRLRGARELERIHLSGTPVTGAGLAHLKGLRNLKVVYLSGTQSVSDAGLEHLGELTGLTDLNLTGTRVSDVGVGKLKNLKRLNYLNLTHTMACGEGLGEFTGLSNLWVMNTPLTDAGVEQLKKLPRLQELVLTSVKLRDEQLAHLKELKALTGLRLGLTPITDAAVAHLKELKGLTELDVTSTRLTANGLAELRAALPNCKVIADDPK